MVTSAADSVFPLASAVPTLLESPPAPPPFARTPAAPPPPPPVAQGWRAATPGAWLVWGRAWHLAVLGRAWSAAASERACPATVWGRGSGGASDPSHSE